MAPHRGMWQARRNQRKKITKSKKFAVEGKLVHRTYEIKDVEKRYITVVNCDELMML